MKSLLVMFFGILFWTHSAFASHARVLFYTRSGQAFQVVLNGHLINRYPSDKVQINTMAFGYHAVEIRYPDKFGILVHQTRIYLEPGHLTEYRIQRVGRHRIDLQKMRSVPISGDLVPPYAGNFRLNPLPEYPDPYRRNDRNSRSGQDNLSGREQIYTDRNRDYECRDILRGPEFERFYLAVANRSFDDSKMALAKQVLRHSTIYAEDLKSLMKLLNFESNKIELAKFMYQQVCDRRNFYMVYDAFSFESSIREMDRFINIQ